MEDFYQNGFDAGYGRKHYGDREYPQTDGDKYSYEHGLDDGRRRRRIADELDREDEY